MLLIQSYLYHKLRKEFSKFYYRHSELQQGISEPVIYGDLVYKF